MPEIKSIILPTSITLFVIGIFCCVATGFLWAWNNSYDDWWLTRRQTGTISLILLRIGSFGYLIAISYPFTFLLLIPLIYSVWQSIEWTNAGYNRTILEMPFFLLMRFLWDFWESFFDVINRSVRAIAQPLIILLVYCKTLCRSCLCFSKPLDSKYQNGHRFCEKCNSEITDNIIDRLVVILDDQNLGRRYASNIFVTPAAAIVDKNTYVDVTDFCVDNSLLTKDENYQLQIDSLMRYLINYPPRAGIKSVKVYTSGKEEMPEHLKRQIDNYFSWGKTNPFLNISEKKSWNRFISFGER